MEREATNSLDVAAGPSRYSDGMIALLSAWVAVVCLAPPPLKLKPVVPGRAPAAVAADPQLIARGAQLVRIGSCDQCHTPKVFDEQKGMPVPELARRLSGHPEGAPDPVSTLGAGDQMIVGQTFTSFRTNFGVSYATNLTPDLETGSGGWTEETFIKAFRTGKHLGNGRPILPPMPFYSLAKATDDELRAVFAFLRSLPPVRNVVPEPKVTPEALERVTRSNGVILAAPREKEGSSGSAFEIQARG